MHSPLPAQVAGGLRHAGEELDSWSGAGSRIEKLLERRFGWIVAVVAGAVGAVQVINSGVAPFAWDWMAISGTALLVVGLALAQTFQPTFEATVDRLRHAGTIVEPDPLELNAWFENRIECWSHRTGLVIGAVMGLAFLAAYGLTPLHQDRGILAFTVVSVLAGYVAGRYIGQAVLFGRLHTALQQTSAEMVLQPGHPDGAAGWRPIGQLYFRQALLLALPAAHLGAWWLLIPAFNDYHEWRDPYAGLLAVVVALEVAAFIWPMWGFHRQMGAKKGDLLREADRVGRDVTTIRAQLANETDTAKRAELNDTINEKLAWYSTLESVPTWPVDRATRRKFTINHLMLAVPLAASWLEQGAFSWSEIGSLFE